MSNILNHNRSLFQLQVNKKNNWDFCLALYTPELKKIKNINTIVDIDLNKCGCVWFDKLSSISSWGDAINNGVKLTNIGYTGIDNGLISYDKNLLSNEQFLDKFLNSVYEIEKGDMSLHLLPINGNNKIYDYTCNITYDGEDQVIECNGGFYQGIWKTKCDEYEILPDFSKQKICFEFELKPCNFKNNKTTLNIINPQNKGIFFYIGTRSENKWWKYYKVKDNFEKETSLYINDDYIDDNCDFTNKCLSYIRDNTSEELMLNVIQNNGYIDSGYIEYNIEDFSKEEIGDCVKYFGDDYIEPDIEINETDLIKKSENHLYEPHNIKEIVSDNKFLLFDRTEDGFTTHNWVEGTKVIIEQEVKNNFDNYFLLFDRTKDGFTTQKIDELKEQNPIEYDLLADLYNNALCFQITDDGRLGYKYLVKDCENNTYKIETEFTKNLIKLNEWVKINVLLIPIEESKQMYIKFYINNKLKLVSRKLPLLNIRDLKDSYKKQEGVPYTISLGGGTQGLCDVVYPNYMCVPHFKLPLEKEFGGSFIGYIKSMKIYNNINYFQELL